MVGNFGGRPSYVQPSWNQRLYPRGEPDFDTVATAPSPRRPPPIAVEAPPPPPPPLYFPGEAQLARTRSQQPTRAGHISSINVARSQTATIPFRSHPTLRHGWRRWVRVDGWYRCLVRREPECFETSWPAEFGGNREVETEVDLGADGVGGGERVSRSFSSRRSGADSGVALTPRTTVDVEPGQQHPLEPLFESRVKTINEIVAKALVPTRVMLAVLEVIDIFFLVLLVVALGVEKGQQRGFLQGVEVALVLIILINGAMVNAVRMKRWALAKELRTLARDWSPLPITSSTNQGLLNNFLGEDDEEARVERMRGKDDPEAGGYRIDL
ncbi:hypothetical protein RQP46_007486 [Phenoliferia psychrophenolica]